MKRMEEGEGVYKWPKQAVEQTEANASIQGRRQTKFTREFRLGSKQVDLVLEGQGHRPYNAI